MAEDLDTSKKKAKTQMDELASTTAAINAALKQFGQAAEASQKELNESNEELKKQKLASTRLKTSVELYKNTVIGQMQVGKQEIAVAKQKVAIVGQELSQARLLMDETQKRIETIKRSRQKVQQSIATAEEEREVVKQEIEQRRESLRYSKAALDTATAERAAVEERIASLTASSQGMQSELDAVNSQIEAYYKLEEQGISVSEEAYYELVAQQYSLMSRMQRNQEQIEQENATRDKLSSGISDLETSIAQETDQVDKLVTQEDALTKGIISRKQLNDRLAAEEAELEASLPGLQEAIQDRTEKLKSAQMEAFNKQIQAGVSVFKSTFAIFKKLADGVGKLVDEVRRTQQQFGLSANQAAKVGWTNLVASVQSYIEAIKSLGKKSPVTRKEIEAAQAGFQEEFGGILTSEAAKTIAIQAKNMGVTASQLAVARRAFMTTTMGDAGKAQAQTNKFISEFAKKGLSAKDAMVAIQQNSELLARNGTRFATSFARAAAEAKKIGVDLGKIDQVGDNIIGDFEGFLEKMSELGAMGFNFDSSRLAEIAESGDTGALMEELRSQLAAQGKDLNNLRRSEQLALSQAFGINIAEMQRMAAPKLEDAKSASGLETVKIEDTGMPAAEERGLWGQVINLLDGLKPVLLGLGGTLGLILGAMTARTGFDALKGLASLGKGGLPGGGVPGVTGTTPNIPGGADAQVTKTGGAFSKLDAKKMLAGAAAMVLVSAALYVTAKAVQEFMKVNWEAMAMAGVALLGLVVAVSAIGSIMMSGVGAVAILAGAAAMVVVAGAVWVLGKALQEFNPTIELFGKIFVAAMERVPAILDSIGGIINNVFNGVVGVITAVADGLVKVLTAFSQLSVGQMIGLATGTGAFAAALGLLSAALVIFPTLEFGRVISRFARLASLNVSNVVSPVKEFAKAIRDLKSAVDSMDTVKFMQIVRGINPSFFASVSNTVSSLGRSVASQAMDFFGFGDDVVSKSGYGDRTLVTPSGPIALNNSDTVVAYADDMIARQAGIDLLSRGAITTNTPTVTVDVSKLEDKLDKVVNAISRMSVNLDGNRVGQVMATSAATVAQVGVYSRG